MTDTRYTQNDLEEALRRFPGAAETDEAMLAEVIRRAGAKGSRSYRGQIAAAAAVLACAVVLPHMGAVTTAMGELMENYRVRNLVTTRLEQEQLTKFEERNHTYIANTQTTPDHDSLECQIWYADTDEPGYAYFFLYKGYTKLLTFDKNIDFDAASAYLREKNGIAVPAAVGEADTAALLRALRDKPTVDVKYADLKADFTDVLLPADPPCIHIFTQYSPVTAAYAVTYFTDNEHWLALTIADAENEIGASLYRNIPVAEDAECVEIGGREVIVTGQYALFVDERYTYVLYDSSTDTAQVRDFIASMR